MSQHLKTRLRTIFIAVTALVAASLIYGFWPVADAVPLLPGAKLAVWMGVTWSMDAHSDAEITQLAADLRQQQVDYAYVYTSYLKADDTFNPTYYQALAFTQRLKAAAPDIALFAWVGVPITIQQSDGTEIANRLTSAATRQQIADFAAYSVTELGFDGFHLNAELIPDEDDAFLQTLMTIRTALPAGVPFSTTAHALRLETPVTLIPYPQIAHHWTPTYLQQVASYTDQIALMTYDSGLIFPRDYYSWVAYQTQSAARSLAGTNTELLIGLPVSEEWTPSHQTQAETIRAALAGFTRDYADTIAGFALYPYWEIDPDEWLAIQAVRR
jgi:hypothetical protein